MTFLPTNPRAKTDFAKTGGTCEMCSGHVKGTGVRFCSDLCRDAHKKLDAIFDMPKPNVKVKVRGTRTSRKRVIEEDR